MKVITIDLETTGLDPWKDKILLIGYSIDNGPIKQIKVYNGEKPTDEFIIALANESIIKRGHNVGNFDLLCLYAHNFVINGSIDDTRILAYLEDPNQELDLKSLTEKRLHRKVVRMEDFGVSRLPKKMVERHPKLTKSLVKSGKFWVSKCTLEKYNIDDVKNCNDLKKELIETRWYKEVEQPLIKILFDTTARGIQLDIPYFERLKNEFETNINALKKSLNAGNFFNPNSSLQVKKIFKEQGINLDSTDKYQLKQLAWNNNDFAKQLLTYRKFTKLYGTYIMPLLQQSDANGRIHGKFNQAGRESLSFGDIKGTATGRLSSSDPNLQNIPDRTEEGKKIRQGFIPSRWKVLIDSDLKQIEPRLIAHFTQSPKLLYAYEHNLDTHAIMGSGIFNKRPEQLTKLERFIGKTSWLATVYGCGYKKLRYIVELNSDEPIFYDDEFYRKIQLAFWETNPEIMAWRRRLLSVVGNSGFIETFGGRKIRIRGIHSNNKSESYQAERTCINYLIQGSAADIMKMLLIELNQKLSNVDLLAVIHDEVLMETNDPTMVGQVDWIMSNSISLKNVPMQAETKLMSNWAEK